MPEREILNGADACDLAGRWAVKETVMYRVVHAAGDFERETKRDVRIISGYRTAQEQASLDRQGRPTAPDDVSTHRSCPATGVDVSLGPFPTRVQKAIWGRVAVMNGLRWGGGGAVDEGGIPVDWGHVDDGPRRIA